MNLHYTLDIHIIQWWNATDEDIKQTYFHKIWVVQHQKYVKTDS